MIHLEAASCSWHGMCHASVGSIQNEKKVAPPQKVHQTYELPIFDMEASHTHIDIEVSVNQRQFTVWTLFPRMSQIEVNLCHLLQTMKLDGGWAVAVGRQVSCALFFFKNNSRSSG
jgi:hypothetical protein